MTFPIPFNNIPLLLGILGMCLFGSGVWTFRIKDFLIPKRVQLFKSTTILFVMLLIGILIYLITVRVISIVVVSPVNQAKVISYLGYISIGASSLLKWLFDPWSKFIKENSHKTESEFLEEQRRIKQLNEKEKE